MNTSLQDVCKKSKFDFGGRRPVDLVKPDAPAPKPKRQHMTILLTMKVYRWLEQRKDAGLNILAVDIERKFNVTTHQSQTLRKMYFKSRGVYYGVH